MGNCTGRNQSKERLNMQSLEQHQHKTKAYSYKECPSDPPSDVIMKSPVLDNGELISKSNRSNGTTPCRIPILKENGLFNNSPLGHTNYKSLLSERSPSSRIPITNSVQDSRKVITMLTNDDDLDNSQLHESGFVSDISVTVSSTHSQIIMDPRSDDQIDVVVSRNRKPLNKARHNIAEHTQESTMSSGSMMHPVNINHAPSKEVVELVVTQAYTTPFTSARCVSTSKVDDKLKRPQSLSTESEIMLHKSQSKRGSDVFETLLSPSVSMHEHSAVMQDVSSLKLMLHKLKRYLTQDGDDRPSDTTNECLFRLSLPLAVDIKCLSRDELEQKYEALWEQNVNLERVLQSREKVIAQLIGDKRVSDKVLHSALGDNTAAGPDLAAAGTPSSYHWSNLKLPNAQI